MIKVTADPARKLVIARMSGFLSVEEVEQFSRDKDAAVESMGLRSEDYLLLIDTAEAIIQPQEIVAAFQHLVTSARYKAGRIAVARKSSLTRMQTSRILSLRDDAAVFETISEAEAWLFA
ncbi:hypothetical protein [Sphingobium sp.]|uniref:hypothetical protein n=1 Tax=Sphingobium sp. TaxID=1912891 RepID=UPI003BB61728